MSAKTLIKRSSKRLIRLALATAIVMAMLGHQQQPASAETWVFGHGWNGNRSLYGTNYARSGKVVGLWKNILAVTYGCVPGLVTSFYNSQWWNGDVETWYTYHWQALYGVPNPDGIVGPQTWAAARWFNLRWSYASYDYESYHYVDTFSADPLDLVLRRYIPWDGWEVKATVRDGSPTWLHPYRVIDDVSDDSPWYTDATFAIYCLGSPG